MWLIITDLRREDFSFCLQSTKGVIGEQYPKNENTRVNEFGKDCW